MGKRIYITEKQFLTICESRKTLLEHESMIDNLADAEKLIGMQWTSPDDYWFIQITQRKKDVVSFNKRNGTNNWWNRVNSIDGTSRENFAGYGVVKGNTKDEAVNCLKNITIQLNDWAAKIMGTNTLTSSGNIEAVRNVCDKLYARAYITINKRSMAYIQKKVQWDKQNGKGMRSFEMHSSRLHDNPRDEQYYPWVMIDNDIDNQKAWDELDDMVKKKGYNPVISHKSHDGRHLFFDKPDIANDKSVDFSRFFRYATNNKPGDPPVLIKRDAKMILYSPCGK